MIGGSQAINAQYVEVLAGSGSASLTPFPGAQTIATTGSNANGDAILVQATGANRPPS